MAALSRQETRVKNDTESQQKQGFVKLMRSPFTIELLRDLLAFGLLALIAYRARWHSGFSTDGLEIGEALIGDYKNCGMTRWQYRERLARLVKWGFITTRPTPKGTIARLTSAAVFDTNLAPPTVRHKTAKNQPSTPPTDLPLENGSQPPTQPPTNRQRAANRPPLTKKERMKEGKNKSSSAHAEFIELWCERFKAATGERYAFQGGKDGKAVKLLLTTTGLTPSQLVAIAETAWKRPTGFWCKFATSIAGYNSRFNQIRKETQDAMAITTSVRDAGRLARARRSQYAGVGKLR